MENKESTVKLEEQGSIHIAEEVVASIAALAVSEVEGVSSLTAGTGVAELLSKKTPAKGVKITMDGAKVNIDVSMLVQYGYQITSVAQKVQESVRSAIETMTGLEAGVINVHINGVSFDKPAKK